MRNLLAGETSTYLLQHADNPVNWYPWGEEALSFAREQDKPILLSIGYAACHWCHVMAHESFEDSETAAIMNENFVNIKVDREERPDLDSIYMSAVVAMTGQGGWPMTVFLTPEGEPFYGGTYYPPVPRYGMPGFKQVLASVTQAWQERRGDVIEQAGNLTNHIQSTIDLSSQGTKEGEFKEQLLIAAQQEVERQFDSQKGGFGRAPKFPQAMAMEFLLRRYLDTKDQQSLGMVELTLEQMAYGGIYDQLGGGFARYSTDNDWLVPHFEKMLYDNALLSRAYLHAWQVTGRPLYRRIAEETLGWALAELGHEGGGFYSSLDADSEGEEGKFYVWSADEIRSHLGDDAEPFMLYYDVTESGNWEGLNILRIVRSIEEVSKEIGQEAEEVAQTLNQARLKLYEERSKRVWPGRDEKILTAWNGLLLASLAEAGRDLNRPDFSKAAVDLAEHLYQHHRTEEGRLWRTWKPGSPAKYNAYLDDYAYLAEGLLALYQLTFNTRWFHWAQELADMMLAHFRDEVNGGFFDTSDDHEMLIHRPKDLQDNAIPSGNSAAVGVLLKLNLYTGESRYWDVAYEATSAMSQAMSRYPLGFAHWLCAADFISSRPVEVAIAGGVEADDTRQLIEAVFAQYRPNQVVAVGSDGEAIPLLQGRTRHSGQAAAYVCRNFVCELPVTEPSLLEDQLS
jgi:uncharacterized protein YyaL (SSP411 family)